MLTPRQKLILKAIVEDYISTAEPMGSRVLSKKFDFGLSPATLRNEMADLEEEGLLKQPHTSAGRIPSDAGYRQYVDGLMDRVTSPIAPDVQRLLERFEIDAQDLNGVLSQAAKVTAVLAQCTAIVRAPRRQASKIQYIQLMPFNEREAMLVVLTEQGSPQAQRVPLTGELSLEDMAVMTNFLNAHLRGRPLDQLTDGLLSTMLEEMARFEQVTRSLWQRLASVKGDEERVFVSHASFLAQQPEFGDALRIRSLLSLLEREQTLANVLSLLVPQGLLARASIGREIPFADLHDCSVITATYHIGDRACGEIGVLGPTRIAYPRAILAVETMARQLSQTLTRLFGQRGSA